MKKQNQSIIDFLSALPASSFRMPRSPVSNDEAQALYDIWLGGKKDSSGNYGVPYHVSHYNISSLTSKGYIKNLPGRHMNVETSGTSLCEFTKKAKDVIQKIILHKERSSFNKSSGKLDYESILREAEASDQQEGKVASVQNKNGYGSWLQRVWK